MTAKDSKSTPKKAERHPLALLAEWIEVGNAVQNYMIYTHEERESNNDRLQELTEDLCEFDPAALRAQAEAEASRERTYRLALLGLQRQDTGCWCHTLTGGHAPECLQAGAALAQAGGE